MSTPGKLRVGTPYRVLPSVLRARQEASQRGALRLELGTVVDVPDELRVTVEIGGAAITIPRLASYVPRLGEPVYILAGGFWTVALGTVSTVGVVSEGFANAAGDLLVGQADDEAHAKPVGADNSVLTADSGSGDGVRWQKVGDAMIAGGTRLAILANSGGSPSSNNYLRGDGTWASPV